MNVWSGVMQTIRFNASEPSTLRDNYEAAAALG